MIDLKDTSVDAIDKSVSPSYKRGGVENRRNHAVIKKARKVISGLAKHLCAIIFGWYLKLLRVIYRRALTVEGNQKLDQQRSGSTP